MPERQEITATYLAERIRFDATLVGSARLVNGSAVGKPDWCLACDGNGAINDTICVSCKGTGRTMPTQPNEITIKGEAEESDLTPGLQYRFLGQWSNYTNKKTQSVEKQFHFHSFVLSEPHGRSGIVKYLQHVGLSPGRANTLWELFGSDAVAKLREDAEAVGQQLDKRFTAEMAAAVSRKLNDLKRTEGVLIDILDLLANRHFRKRTPMLAVQKWGEKAPDIIRRNPYSLMEFPGAGFKLCDAMYCEIYAGNTAKLAAVKRQSLCAWNALHKDSNGDTWKPIGFAVNAIKGSIAGAQVEPQRAIKLAKRANKIAVMRTDAANKIVESDSPAGIRWWIAERRRADAEKYCAEKLATLFRSNAKWPGIGSARFISDHQKERLATATSGPVGCFVGGPGTGKAQPLDAKVLTPDGWRLMGEITVGDFVIGGDGKPVMVKAVFPQGEKQIYSVRFSDGSKTECCEEHLWFTKTRNDRKHGYAGKVRSLAEIMKKLDRGDGSPNHSIPMVAPVQLNKKPVPIEPYLLGLLLGDGCFRSDTPDITNPEPEITEAVRRLIPADCKLDHASKITYKIKSKTKWQKSSLKSSLEKLGLYRLKSESKFVPDCYKFNSSEVRLAVLQGLLDTDGSTSGFNLEYSTSSQRLADDVKFLVESLGGKVSTASRIPAYTYLGEKRLGQESYRILITMPPAIAPFRLKRKASKHVTRTKYIPARRIESVDPVGIKYAKCISVDSADGLYVTDDFIVTHNTFTLGILAELLIKEFGHDAIAFASPTNKAAVRLSQSLKETGVKATSIHRLLGVDKVEGANWQFKHDESFPLPHKVVCLDESSMLSPSLTASVLRAIIPGTLLLFIGDINQLPPIEHGAVLRDLLLAGIPRGELTEPQRNAGAIVEACDDIRCGRRFRESNCVDLTCTPPKNFKIVAADSPQQQIEKLLGLLNQAKQRGLDPIWDCQVMVAVNSKSMVSRKIVNELLQRELNSGGTGPANSPFKVNDKVVCDENGQFPCVDTSARYADSEGKTFIAKGEFGQVIASEQKLVTVKFDSPEREVKFPRGNVGSGNSNSDNINEKDSDTGEVENESSNTGCALSLAYGATVHKLQGSEVAMAIPLIDEAGGAKRLCTREWWFTAISRGKKLTIPIGQRRTADEMCKRQALPKRKTFLSELLKKELAK